MKTSLIAMITLLSTCVVTGQNNTSSPYTVFGIGEIEPIGFGATQGMGGMGLAVRSPLYLNPSNPASYGFLQEHSAILESGFFFKKNYSQTSSYKDKFTDINLKYFALAFAPGKKLRTSFGLRPYSSIGYKISSEQAFEGTQGSYQVEYTGAGGMNQFYVTNSYLLTKNLSLGVNLSYLWGYAEQTEFLGLAQTLSYDINTRTTTYMGGLNLDYGLQYTSRIKGDWHFTLGMVFDNASKIHTEESKLNYRSLVGVPFDTLSQSEETLADIVFPHSGGIGLAIGKGNQLTITA
ncbi:MAG: hypothetical protein R3B93_26470, partial [Bacteroidia bacterium]